MPDGAIVEANAHLVRMLGFASRDELRSHTADALHADPRDRARYLEDLRQARGRVLQRDVRLRGPDGRDLWVRDVARAVVDRDGNLVRIDGAMQDITQERRVQQALEASEARYRELVEDANDLVYSFDPDGRIRAVNGHVLRLLGWSVEEVVDRSVFEIVHPEHMETARRHHVAKLEGREDASVYEIVVRRRDGTPVWVEVSSRAVRRDGRIVAIQGIIRDVDARRRAQEERARAEEAYQGLVERLPVGLFRTTPDGRLLDVNPALVRILGYATADEVKAKRMQEHYADPADRDRLLESALADTREGRTPAFEARFRRADGSVGWVRGTSRPVFDSDGLLAHLEGHLEDITESRLSQAALDVVHRLALGVNQAGDFPTALGLVLRELCAATGWTYAEAWSVREGEGHLACVEAFNAAGERAEKLRRLAQRMEFAPGQGLAGHVWAGGQTVWAKDLSREPSFERAHAALAAGLRSGVAVPVRAAGRAVAVLLFLHERTQPEDWRWIHVAETAATQLGGVMARRRAEDQLRRQTALLEAQVEASPDGVLVVAQDGSVLAANRRLLEMCGVALLDQPGAPALAPSRWVGQELLGRIDDPRRFASRVRFLYEDPGGGRDEVVLEGRTYRRHDQAVRDEDDLLLGRIWHFRDVTQERKLAEKLAALGR